MNGNNNIKSSQLMLLTFITQTGIGIIILSSDLAKQVGHDGWISILITGIIMIIISALFVLFLRRYKDKDIYKINEFIFGKFLGFIFNVLLIIYLLVNAVGSLSIFNFFIRINILHETPAWILAPFIILPTIYLVWQGLKYVGRFLYIAVVAYIIIIIYTILIYNEYKFSFLMPIGEAGIMQIISSIKTSFFAYLGFELIVFIYPEISDKENALKSHISATLMSIIFFLIITIVSTAIFGENLLSKLSMPFFDLSRVYNAPIFERVDLYYIGLWFIPTACSMRSYVFVTLYSMEKVFKLKKTRLIYGIFFVIIILLSSIPRNINQVLKFIEVINISAIAVTLFILICFILSFIRTKGVRVHE